MALQNNEVNLNNFFIADVVEINPSTRRLAVYIPKLMPGIPNGASLSSNILTTNNPNVSGVNYTQTINIRNSIWVYPWDYDEKLPKPGSKVIVRFFEANPKMGYWDKFNPLNNYEVIDDEKYEKLFKLKFGSSEITAEADDNITINLPDGFSSAVVINDKEKTLNLIRDENYVISETQPEEPRSGMLWYNSSENQLYLYRVNRFSKLLTEEDLQLVYQQIDVISRKLEDQVLSSRLFFVERLSNFESPIDGQIAVIDSEKAGNGFYRYDRIDSFVALIKSGYYYLKYSNRFIQITDAGEEISLNAFKYENNKWVKLDGWFEWTQPSSLGDFISGSIDTTVVPKTLEWDFRDEDNYDDSELRLKVYSIKLSGFSIATGTAMEFRFYTGADYSTGTKIGVSFMLKNTAGVYSFIGSSSIYQQSYLTQSELFIPDISAFGIETTNLKCDILSVSGETQSTSITLGTIAINAKSNKEVE